MRKRKKTILIIIMILIVATLFMNNSVLAAPTAGITSAIGDSLKESTSEEKTSSNPSAAGIPSDVEEQMKVEDSKVYEEIDKKINEYNNIKDTKAQEQIKENIEKKLDSIQLKNTSKYKEYSEKIENIGKVTTVDSDEKVSTGTGSDPIANPNFFSPTVNTATNASKLKDMANDIVGAIRVLGTVLAIIILIFMGYKYMIGSASDRADFKNSMIPYLTGAILLFTIPNLLGILYDLVKNIKL